MLVSLAISIILAKISGIQRSNAARHDVKRIMSTERIFPLEDESTRGRVGGFTTNDLYREGFKQNCSIIVENNFTRYDSSNGTKAPRFTDEQRLTCFLLHNYSTSIRPVSDFSSIIVINFTIAVNHIFDLDDSKQTMTTSVWLEQTWIDETFRWNPSDFGGLRAIALPDSFIFVPDIELYNAADGFSKRKASFRAMIHHNGVVFYGSPAKFSSTCHINPTYFPFDTQICHLKFGSWSYSGYQVDMQPSRDSIDLSRFIQNGKWFLREVVQRRRSVSYTCCPEPFVDISYYFIIERRPAYYLLGIYFHVSLLAVLAVVTYKLPQATHEKCALGTAILFSTSVFTLAISQKLPESSDYVPVVNIYLFSVQWMTAATLMFTVGIDIIYYRQTTDKGQIKRLPKLLRRLIMFWRCCQGRQAEVAASESVRKCDEKKQFLRQLRRYQRETMFQLNDDLFSRQSEMLAKQGQSIVAGLQHLANYERYNTSGFPVGGFVARMAETICTIHGAIKSLADCYELQIDRAFYLLEWQELAELLDALLFWCFSAMTLWGICFVIGLSLTTAPTGSELLKEFDQAV